MNSGKNKEDHKREKAYQKNENQEGILGLMNEHLALLEEKLIAPFDQPLYPPVFIVGAQRSGSTVLNQLIINQYQFTYPDHIIARFWQAPALGVNLSRTLLPKNKKNIALSSDLGYTPELSGPHEFSYFWRSYFPDQPGTGQDPTKLKKQLAAMEHYGAAPLLFKNLVQVDLYIEKLYELLPHLVVLYIKRDPFYTIQSTYLSRLKLYNDENAWFGVKPPEYEYIKGFKTIEQIAAQVNFTQQLIDQQLQKLPTKQKMEISYEALAGHTKATLNAIHELLIANDKVFNTTFKPQTVELKNSNKIKVSEKLAKEIKEVCEKYFLQE